MGRLILGALSLWVLYLETAFLAATQGKLFESAILASVSSVLIIQATAILVTKRLISQLSR